MLFFQRECLKNLLSRCAVSASCCLFVCLYSPIFVSPRIRSDQKPRSGCAGSCRQKFQARGRLERRWSHVKVRAGRMECGSGSRRSHCSGKENQGDCSLQEAPRSQRYRVFKKPPPCGWLCCVHRLGLPLTHRSCAWPVPGPHPCKPCRVHGLQDHPVSLYLRACDRKQFALQSPLLMHEWFASADDARRPKSTEPVSARSYTSQHGTNVHNYWKKGKPAAESHAPVFLEQATFQRPASRCELPSTEKQLGWGTNLGVISATKGCPLAIAKDPVQRVSYKAGYLVDVETQLEPKKARDIVKGEK